MNSITGYSSSATLSSRTANRMDTHNSTNTSQNNSFRDCLPEKKIITGIAAFSALAATTMVLTYLFCRATGLYNKYSNIRLDNEDFESIQLTLLSTAVALVNVFNRLGSIGAIGVDAHVFNNEENQQFTKESSSSLRVRIEEIDDCDRTIAQMLPQVLAEASTCKAAKLSRQNRTEFQLLKDRGLASNLKLAEQILEETQKTILISPNNLVRSKKLLYNRARQQGLELKNLYSLVTEGNQCLSKIRVILDLVKLDLVKYRKYSSFELKKINAELAEKSKIGMCGEMVLAAFFKALKKGGWNIQVEAVMILNGNHAFLVIGRDPRSDPTDYRTWGPSAVVLDPWAEKDNIFLFKEINLYLKDYVGLDMETGDPLLIPFNPSTNSLRIISLNIYHSQNLLNYAKHVPMSAEQTNSFQKIVKKLDLFRQSEHLQTKVDLANELVDLCLDDSIGSLNLIIELREQVEYFIELSHL